MDASWGLKQQVLCDRDPWITWCVELLFFPKRRFLTSSLSLFQPFVITYTFCFFFVCPDSEYMKSFLFHMSTRFSSKCDMNIACWERENFSQGLRLGGNLYIGIGYNPLTVKQTIGYCEVEKGPLIMEGGGDIRDAILACLNATLSPDHATRTNAETKLKALEVRYPHYISYTR